MWNYAIAGTNIRSNFQLINIPPASADNEQPIIFLTVEPESNEQDRDIQWYSRWTSGSEKIPWTSFGRVNSDYLIRFHGQADFYITENSRVTCRAKSNTPKESLQHLFLDQIFPILQSCLGKLVLHSAAVEYRQGKALLLIGASGVGKSTLCAKLCEGGMKLISDDFAVIDLVGEDALVNNSYPAIRLWSSEQVSTNWEINGTSHLHSKKCHIPPDSIVSSNNTRCKIDRIYFVENLTKSEPRIEDIKKSDALVQISSSQFLLDPANKSVLQKTFEQSSLLLDSVSANTLYYPHKKSSLSTITDSLLVAN